MNMKKTIAAIAAGAVAVSAMATTASAITLETRTLTYNLVKSVKNDDASGTFTATFSNVPIAEDGHVTVRLPSSEAAFKAQEWNTVVTLSGTFWDDAAGNNKAFTPVVATKCGWETGYSFEGSQLVVADDAPGYGGIKVVVPVKAATAQGTNVALRQTTSANITVTVKRTGLPSSIGSVQNINDAIKDGKLGIILEVDGSIAGSPAVPGVHGAATAAIGTDWTGGTGGAEDAAITGTPDVDAMIAAGLLDEEEACAGKIVTLTATVKSDSSGLEWSSDPDALNITVTEGTLAYAKQTTGTIVITVAAGTPGTPAGTPVDCTWTSARSGSGTEAGGNGTTKIPFRTTLNSASTNLYAESTEVVGDNEGNVLTHVWDANDESGQVSPVAIRAVINDAIANYSDITFTFNTATKNVEITRDTKGNVTSWKYTDAGTKAKEDTTTWDAILGGTVVNGSKEIVDFKSFGRHYWGDAPGYNPETVYITNDWINNNLFEGALIVNGGLTLSLKDTAKFDWTATSLSFSWDAIQDGALTQNSFANYIQTMVLRTSADWYWDNFQVTLGETEVEEVESGAPVEGDVEDLPEDEEETDLGDVDEPEEEEEEEEESEPEPEVAPAVETNPGTGNAPVALAVIPVALAAAAIVAKKRG